MTNSKIQFVGSPCGQHGSYTFYKAIKYILHGKQKILSLGEFFFVKFFEQDDIISIGEPQLLWEDKSSANILISMRLYFLPENTPDGRCEEHGEHEVISLSDKIIMRVEDVINIMRSGSDIEWETGLEGVFGAASEDPLSMESPVLYSPPIADYMDIREIARERSLIGDTIEPTSQHVIVLGYNKYCRMRALLKRLEGVTDEMMKSTVVRALGGFLVPSRSTRLVYCRDVFEYTELEGHELLCNHLAPKLQGRPRKRRRRPESESESSETSDDQRTWLKATKPGFVNKSNSLISAMNQKPSNHALSKSHLAAMAEQMDEFETPTYNRLVEVDFMTKLHKFMKERNTTINRMPVIDGKQINVFELFTRVQEHGGYDIMCQKKLWKSLYEELSSKQMSYLSGGHNTYVGGNALRKQYERLLLPYENFLLQEQKKIYSKKSNNSKIQRNFNKNLKKAFENIKPHIESCEPSVSILQSPTAAIGASFEVADGGSTTITLIPSSSEPQLSDSVTSSISISPIDEAYSQITIPKFPMKSEPPLSTAEITKRPEITITAIPRDSSGISSTSLTSLQLADLVSMNSNMNSSIGVSALHDLAKYAERCDKISKEPKRHKPETSRLNGASGQRSTEDRWATENKGSLPVPDLVSTDLLRHMNMLEPNSKYLLPAHQSSKTIHAALATLLPHTSIYPAQVPAAHQQHSRVSYKPQVDSSKPEPVFQSQSVYSQSKNMYSKPDSPIKETNHDRNRNSSPEIEILDLRVATDTRPNINHCRNDRLEIELLDLSNRKDITVSAVCKPSSSRNSNSRSTPPAISIRPTESSRPQVSYGGSPKLSPVTNNPSNPLAALSIPGLSPSALASLGMTSPVMMQYLMSGGGTNAEAHSPPGSSVPPFLPYIDPATMAAYYNLLPHGLMPHVGHNSAGVQGAAANNAAMAAAAQQHAALTSHLAQLNAMGLSGLSNVSPGAIASLGIYKNYLPPHGTFPAPHFLSGLMSPGAAHPPPK